MNNKGRARRKRRGATNFKESDFAMALLGKPELLMLDEPTIGILGYEGELNQEQNLEELFMDVVRKNRKAGESRKTFILERYEVNRNEN